MGQLGQLEQLRRHVFGGGERRAIVFNQLELASERHLTRTRASVSKKSIVFGHGKLLLASERHLTGTRAPRTGTRVPRTGTRAPRTGTRGGMGRRPSCATWAAAYGSSSSSSRLDVREF